MQAASVVIVTYNRLNLLQVCLESVRAQTNPVTEIILVNNGSTDGTKEWLDQQTGMRVIHQENVGSSGGYKTGIDAAMKAGAEWIWIMDDDVRVEPDCLENLMKYSDQSHCLHPRKLYADGPEFNGETFFDINSALTAPLQNISFRNGKEIFFTNTGCFEGMLLHRSLVEKIGLPDERFFIVQDDMIYGWLASLYTNVAYVKSALMHSVKLSAVSEETDFYLYYYIRNRHLVVETMLRYFPNANPRTRSILWRLYILKKLFIFPMKNRNTWKARWKTFKVIWRAAGDNRKKKTGKTF